MKYKEWLDVWFANYIEPSSKTKTCERYSEIIEKHLKVKLGEYELEELSPIVIQKYITELMQSGNLTTGKGLAANSVNGIITVIQNSLKLAYTLGELKEYTTDKIRRPKTKEKGCFTYYINREYNDIILPAAVFSTKYSVLTDWLKDNAKTTKESDEVFNISNMYDINVYLDDGLNSTGITGYAYSDYINMYSVGSFSHEYIHHILFYLGKSGYAREVIPEMHASTSKYAMAMWYYLFTGQAKNFPYNKEVKEKETYLQTLTLYKKYKVKTPTVDDFDFWLFADCFSAIYTEKGTTFIHRVQTDSLAYYIARVYGTNYVWQINMNTQIVIEGKPYLDVVDEWYNYIKSLNH